MAPTAAGPDPHDPPPTPPGRRALIVFSWLWVGIPLTWGLYELARKATQLFTG